MNTGSLSKWWSINKSSKCLILDRSKDYISIAKSRTHSLKSKCRSSWFKFHEGFHSDLVFHVICLCSSTGFYQVQTHASSLQILEHASHRQVLWRGWLPFKEGLGTFLHCQKYEYPFLSLQYLSVLDWPANPSDLNLGEFPEYSEEEHKRHPTQQCRCAEGHSNLAFSKTSTWHATLLNNSFNE